jgi:hypothetical protein
MKVRCDRCHSQTETVRACQHLDPTNYHPTITRLCTKCRSATGTKPIDYARTNPNTLNTPNLIRDRGGDR